MNSDQRQILDKQTSLLYDISGNTFVSSPPNNLEKLKTEANDLLETYTWLDGGTDNQRISTIVYHSELLSLTVTETFTYNGGAGTYHVATSTLS